MLSCLRELVLGGNAMGAAGAAALAPALKPRVLPRLANLRVWQNELGDDGVATLVGALTGSTALTSLDCEECGIGVVPP